VIVRVTGSEQLALTVEHYMAAVSEELLSREIEVKAMRGCGPYHDGDYYFPDAEGEISVVAAGTGRSSCTLYWSGTSGWCCEFEADDSFNEEARWMCTGLLPPPGEVALSFDALINDSSGVGSEEAPTYRKAGGNLPELMELLKEYAPEGSDDLLPSQRLIAARQDMYVRRITDLLYRWDASPSRRP